jgi:hypothetical protein
MREPLVRFLDPRDQKVNADLIAGKTNEQASRLAHADVPESVVRELPQHQLFAEDDVAVDDTIAPIWRDAPTTPRMQPIEPLSVAPTRGGKMAPEVAIASELGPPETIVHVTIGRVEIRADVQSKAKVKEPQPRYGSQTLEEYLHGVQPGSPS